LQAQKGDRGDALISSAGLLPIVGDVAKVGKLGKDVKIIETAIDAVKESKTTIKVVNGISRKSQKAQHLYEIFDKETGEVVKTGISGGKITKKGKFYRATQQVNKWNRMNKKDVFDSRIVRKIPAGKNAREKLCRQRKLMLSDFVMKVSLMQDITKDHRK
jgi:putative membrane protein